MKLGGNEKRHECVEFLLLDLFSMMSVTCAIEPLRAANRLLGFEAYSWRFSSEDGSAAHASNGISVNVDERFGTSDAPEYLFVCAGMTFLAKDQTRLNVMLKRRAREGCHMGALSMGTVFLARAGLLTDARCTLHWEGQPAFREEFPFIELSNQLYVIDRNRYTCAGGAASLDMILHIITQAHGAVLARSIANQFQVERIRTGNVEQRSGSSVRLVTLPPELGQTVGLMMRNLEKPLSTSSIARTFGLSVRKLERLFQRHTGYPPARYYKILRLEHARDLLLHTSLANIDIAIATGFCSSSYFSASYAEHFGHTPSQERQ
ncbi:GlxA family transcriptional regulator [Mesorhizobium australicum]|uniref:GlxA family transcriptional regulator n=1 Tax=Mesorhizobium australicum TaxID=536018 RepID=UPI00333609EB